jgi:sugar (pentulose or hexulose) kinase
LNFPVKGELHLEYLLSLDAGTSSMRGGIYDRAGARCFFRQILYTVCSSRDGRVEMDPKTFLNALLEITRAAGEYCEENKIDLFAVVLTSQRSSLITVDLEGNPLRDAIMWQDKRTALICDEVNQRFDTYKVCGMVAMPVFTAPKILWLRQNERDIFDKAYKFLGVHEYLLYRLTGNFVTDVSVASRSCLLDICRLRWSDELLSLFEVDPKKLCNIVSVGAVCGMTTDEISSLLNCKRPIPVIAAGGDQQCAALGMEVTCTGVYSVNCGTGAYAVTIVEAPLFDPCKNVICNVSAIPGKWILEASTMSSGMVYNWFNSQFYQDDSYQKANADAAASPAGANGVIMLPDLMGRGMPDWDDNARGTFYNIGYHTQKSDFTRAVMESLAAELSNCLVMLRELTGKIGRVRCSGGLAKNSLFNQIQADMYGVPVYVKKNCEATMRGAWASATVTLGWHSDYNQAFTAEICGREEKYTPDEKNASIYRKCNCARHLLYKSINTKTLGKLLNKV